MSVFRCRYYLLVLFIAFCILSFLPAQDMSTEFLVTYQESFDTTIRNGSDFQVSIPGYAVVCEVGTLQVLRLNTNYTMYGLRLDRSNHWGNGNEYKLDYSKEINWQKHFGARLVAKITCGNKSPVVKSINWGTGKDPLVDSNHLLDASDFPIVVDFYLAINNIDNAAQAEGVRFQFQGVGGHNLGDFQIISTRHTLHPQWGYDIYLEVVLPFDSSDTALPFYSINYNKKSEHYLNGVIQQEQVYAHLSIEEVLPGGHFDLLGAIGANQKVQIAQARISLYGSDINDSYGVNLRFVDGNGSLDDLFLLKHEYVDTYIPFVLYLGGQVVNNNEEIPWDGLVFSADNIRSLEVGDISYSDVENKVSGLYSDTITVHISPMDTNMIVQ